jgi:hypothetical protein
MDLLWPTLGFIRSMVPVFCAGLVLVIVLPVWWPIIHVRCTKPGCEVFEQDLLAEFEPEESVTYDALIFCDMTTGPDGKAISFEDRVREVYERYGEGDISRALRMAEPCLKTAVDRISQAMKASDRPER